MMMHSAHSCAALACFRQAWRFLFAICLGLFLLLGSARAGTIDWTSGGSVELYAVGGTGYGGSLTVGGGLTLPAVTSTNAVLAALNAPFSYQIMVTGSADSFDVIGVLTGLTLNSSSSLASGLPAGLTLDSSRGLISGTPSATGTTQVNLSATYASTTVTFNNALTITVVDGLVVQVSGSGSVTEGLLGASFPDQGTPISIQATPAADYSFAGWTGSITSGSNPLNFTYNGSMLLQANFVPTPPAITSTTSATTWVKDPFSYQITASHSPTSYSATGLPNGLTLNAATGLISGTTLASGTTEVLLNAINLGGTGSATLSIISNPLVSLLVTPNPQGGQGGTVTAALTGTTFHHGGDPISLKATPAYGYQFTGWSGDISSTDNPLNFDLEADTVLQANFSLIPMENLTVSASLGGTVTPSGTSVLRAGTLVTLRSTPAPGYLFDHWIVQTGSLGSSSVYLNCPSFTIPLADSQWTAQFTPWSNCTGSYFALISGSDQPIGGNALSLKVTGLGSFSGNIVLGGTSYAFADKFYGALGNKSSMTITRKGQSALYLTLQLDLSTGVPLVTGSATWFSSGQNVAVPIAAEMLGRFSKTTPCPQAGYYTVALNTVPLPPQHFSDIGDTGFMTLTISNLGAVKMAGVLPDGTAFSNASALNPEGGIPVAATIYKQPWALLGLLDSGSSNAPALSGTFQWSRPWGFNSFVITSPTTAFISHGNSVSLTVSGAPYQAAPALLCFSGTTSTSGTLSFSGRNLSQPFTQGFTVDPAGRVSVAPPNPHSVSLKLDLKTGAFTGKFWDSALTRNYKGVLIAPTFDGVGGFYDKQGNGSVLLNWAGN